MKAFLKTVFALMLVLTVVACQDKKKSGARFEDRGTRAVGVSQSAQQVGISTVVTAFNRSSWMSSVRRLVSSSISEEYLMDVSPDGTNNTGVFLGLKLCVTPGYGAQQIPQKALVVVQVYDGYKVPVPIYLNAVQGSVGNGTVDAVFADEYGQIRIYAQQVDQYNYRGTVQFNTRVRFDGSTDNYGWEDLGGFYIQSNQLFSCY